MTKIIKLCKCIHCKKEAKPGFVSYNYIVSLSLWYAQTEKKEEKPSKLLII